MIAKYFHRPAAFCALFAFILTSASCHSLEKRVAQVAQAPARETGTPVASPSEPPASPERIGEATIPPGPLQITVEEAVLMCLENNHALRLERLNPEIQQTYEEQEKAVFDPTAAAEATVEKFKGERLARSGSDTETYETDEADAAISLEQFFPSGTTVALELDSQMDDSSLYEDTFFSTRLGMTVTQALLQGFGTDANLARLRQARLDTRMSEYELRGFTESLVADVERTYWDYALARRQIEIVEGSLEVSHQQLRETEQLIEVGRLAKSELAAVQAEVALQEQALIEARAAKETVRLNLLRLLNPPGNGGWDREIELIHKPTLPDIRLEDVGLHVAVSMRMRPVLNEARLQMLRDDLEIVKTRNGLLPLLELFVTLGKTGYANSFGDSARHIDEDNFDALAGVRFEYPFYNRNAKARHQRALITRDQAGEALENLARLVEVEVRTSHIEVRRTRQQIDASSATRKFNEEKVRIETEKMRVGKSTGFLVAQAQRDLLSSRIAEVRALANYLKALIDLYRLDGSLLERRGIEAPGRQQVELSGGRG